MEGLFLLVDPGKVLNRTPVDHIKRTFPGHDGFAQQVFCCQAAHGFKISGNHGNAQYFFQRSFIERYQADVYAGRQVFGP